LGRKDAVNVSVTSCHNNFLYMHSPIYLVDCFFFGKQLLICVSYSIWVLCNPMHYKYTLSIISSCARF
jgi:hypothetical protein